MLITDFVDGGGAPVGFEDEGLAEDGVVLEVEAGTEEVVEKLAELEHGALVGGVVAAAGIFVVVEADVVAAAVFEGVADVEPFGEGDAARESCSFRIGQ